MPTSKNNQTTHHLSASGLEHPIVSQTQRSASTLRIGFKHHMHRVSRLYRLTNFSGLSAGKLSRNSFCAKNFFREWVVFRFVEGGHFNSADGAFPSSISISTPEGFGSKAGFEGFIQGFLGYIGDEFPLPRPPIHPKTHY